MTMVGRIMVTKGLYPQFDKVFSDHQTKEEYNHLEAL